MNQYVDDLSGYHREKLNTTSCFLDGRFFELVFARYPGLRPTIYLEIKDKKEKGVRHHKHSHKQEKVFLFYAEQNPRTIDPKVPGIARLSIKINNVSHCNLLIFDYENKIIYRLEPLGQTAGNHFEEINDFLEQMADGYELININLTVVPETNLMCERSGYCVAYCILYTYAFLTQTPFEPDHIRKFARYIEKRYRLPLHSKPEIEYGLFGDGNVKTGNVLGGAAIGGVIGGLTLGVPGAAAGLLGGSLIGAAL